MKKYFKINGLLLGAITVMFASCLKSGLDKDLPVFNEAKITDIFFEYRYIDPDNHSPDGADIVRVIELPVSNKVFKLKEDSDAETDSVIATVSVPPAERFTPASEWDKVAASNLVVKSNISTAARVEPIGNAPKMGVPGDFSASVQYRIIGADGETERIWTIKITLVK